VVGRGYVLITFVSKEHFPIVANRGISKEQMHEQPVSVG